MPTSAHQLAALVERAKLKAPPVVSPPPPPAQRSVPPRRASPAPSTTRPVPAPRREIAASTLPTAVTLAAEPRPAPLPASSSEPDDFPTGWELSKESWHFHRRFYAIFRRSMRRGEYSHMLWQIRRRTAEHLWEDCWRVKLPGGDRTLPVRATPWRLITILPKHWQPPARGESGAIAAAADVCLLEEVPPP